MSAFFTNLRHHRKSREQKKNFQTTPVHNILELYNIIAKVRFATRKTKFDIFYSKLGIPVVSQVSERLQTEDLRKLGNITKMSNLDGDIKLWQ